MSLLISLFGSCSLSLGLLNWCNWLLLRLSHLLIISNLLVLLTLVGIVFPWSSWCSLVSLPILSLCYSFFQCLDFFSEDDSLLLFVFDDAHKNFDLSGKHLDLALKLLSIVGLRLLLTLGVHQRNLGVSLAHLWCHLLLTGLSLVFLIDSVEIRIICSF